MCFCVQTQPAETFTIPVMLFIQQLQELYGRTVSSKNQLEEEVKELNEKRETVAQMETQIAEIIQW
jgi:hypothetical protein